MIKGDPGIEDIYKWGPASGEGDAEAAAPRAGACCASACSCRPSSSDCADSNAGALTSPLAGPTPGTTTDTRQRGATGGGDGVHVLTGPIYVNGAQPGDVLKVEILALPKSESRRSLSTAEID